MMPPLARWIALVLVGCTALGTTSLTAQRNLDFEAEAAGEKVSGWFVPTAGYRAEAQARKAPVPGTCGHLRKSGDGRTGNLMQMVDAKRFRGRYVRLRAEIRAQRGSTARLWLRVDRPDGKRGFFDSMGNKPVTDTTWRRYDIVGKVAEDATRLAIGVMLIGSATWIDNVELTAIELPKGAGPEAPRPLKGQAHRNVSALARLIGLVRYFHPSTEASQIDWEIFTIQAVRAVESATNDVELAKRLEKIFSYVAPTVQVATRKGGFPVPAALRPPADNKGIDVVAWQHRGMGQQKPGIYQSEIVSASLSGGALGLLLGNKKPSDLPKPAEPLVLELVDGLHCALPLALYRSGENTLPHPGAVQPDEIPVLPATAEDRATRLAAVILGWNVFQHFYPYFDVVEVDWNSALYTALYRAARDPGPAEFLVTLREMVARLHDGHGYVGHHSDPNTGTLPVLFAWAGEQLVVAKVLAGAAGFKRGDCITHFDDETVTARAERLGRQVSASTAQFRRYRLLTDLRRGLPGTEVTLQVRRGSRTAGVPTEYSRGFVRGTEDRPDQIAELAPGVWYVDVGRVTTDDFKAAVPQLATAKGIAFDFRGYPSKLDAHTLFGHIIDQPAQSAQWHIPIPDKPDRIALKFHASGRWLIKPRTPHFAAKLVFITDGRAVSYAESCMGIVEHYKLGAIVGEATAGTNGNVNPFALPGGYSVSWTGMKVLKHDGSQHHGVGILPTVPMQRTVAGIRAGRDEFLARAMELLKK